MAASNILREYLVALGFKVDDRSNKKVVDSLDITDKRIKTLGKSVLGAAVAVKAMVTVYAYQMDKLYWASKRTGATVSGMQAMEFAAKKVGVAGGSMQTNLENFARNLRNNPGFHGLLRDWGIETLGRDMEDIFHDAIRVMANAPTHIGSQLAGLLGIDPDDLYMMAKELPKYLAEIERRKGWAKDAGVDADKAAKAGMEYAKTLQDIWEKVGLLKDALSIKLLPAFREFADVTSALLTDWTHLINRFTTFEDFAKRMKEGLFGGTGGGVKLSDDAKKRLGITDEPAKQDKGFFGNLWQSSKDRHEEWKRKQGLEGDSAPAPAPAPSPGQKSAPGADSGRTNELFDRLESKYALPKGLLDRIWKAESNRGDPRYMKSHAGAEGHMGFMPATAKDVGLDDPYNLEKAAKAAAKYMQQLLKRYNGDLAKATAAYNWGMGNVDRLGLGAAPKETRDYVQKVAAPIINQTNNITVSGMNNPQEVAARVNQGVRQANADLQRNLTPRVQ